MRTATLRYLGYSPTADTFFFGYTGLVWPVLISPGGKVSCGAVIRERVRGRGFFHHNGLHGYVKREHPDMVDMYCCALSVDRETASDYSDDSD